MINAPAFCSQLLRAQYSVGYRIYSTPLKPSDKGVLSTVLRRASSSLDGKEPFIHLQRKNPMSGPSPTPALAASVNIFSGTPGLGGALTNPTEWARNKGAIPKAYRVVYAGRMYPDAEAAYQQNKTGTAEGNDIMMVEVICAKFNQYPELAAEVRACGGADWLKTCTHFTYAKSPGAQSWEGAGLESRFIRNLVQAWEQFESGSRLEKGQAPLF